MSTPSRTDIHDRRHIEQLVNSFYGEVRQDALLGPIFNGVIGDRWPEHLEKMYRFWATVLINESSYTGTPLRPHLPLPIGGTHFERWLHLFHQTVDRHFEGPVAELAKRNAARMATMFQERITLHRTHPQNFIQ